MPIQHEGDAAGVERGAGEVVSPLAGCREIDVGRHAMTLETIGVMLFDTLTAEAMRPQSGAEDALQA
jgi:hypothetical protein